MRRIVSVVLLMMVLGSLSSIVVETASLQNFLLWREPNCAYDYWISHVSEGIVIPNYNLYAPWDRQTNGFGNFTIPTNTQLTNWQDVIDAFMAQQWQMAQDLLVSYNLPFQVVQFNDTDSGRTLYMIREEVNWSHFDDNGTMDDYDDEIGAFDFGWGIFIYNPEGTRPIIVTVPHPNDDFPTPSMGYHGFQTWNAKFLLINGAGREVRWTNVEPYTNGKSISDPTRNAYHPFNTFYKKGCDLIRDEFQTRELSVQVHSYDWNRHEGHANIQISAGNNNLCPNLPIRDLSYLKHDLINKGNHVMIPANTYGIHSNVYLNDYYAVYYNIHDFIFSDGENSYPVNNQISLPGYSQSQQMIYTQQGLTDYDVFEPFFHIELDELPNAYAQTENNLKWFYGWNEGARLWDLEHNFTRFTEYYMRWVLDLEDLLDDLFTMDDGLPPTDPTNLTVVNQSLNYITLRWERSSAYDFHTYEILYATTPISEGNYSIYSRNQSNILASQAMTQVNVTNLQNAQTYYFRIRALDKNGSYSALSNEVIGYTAPANVVSFVAIGRDGSNDLYWSVSGQVNNAGFKIYRKTDDTPWALSDSYVYTPSLIAGSNNYQWTDTSVLNNEYYTYRLSMVSTNGGEFYHNVPASCSARRIHTLYYRNFTGTVVDSVAFSNNLYATDGQDAYFDQTRSGASGSNYTWIAFWRSDWGQQGTNLYREVKGFFDPDTQIKDWTIRTRSDLTGQTLVIEADDSFDDRAEKLYLYDGTNSVYHNLLAGGYQFTVVNSNVRTMTLFHGNMQPRVAIGDRPNRIYQGGENISFTWSPQYSFLINRVDLSIQSDTDSIFVAANLQGTTSIYTYQTTTNLTIHNARLVIDITAVDGIRSRVYSPYRFGIVPYMSFFYNDPGLKMRANTLPLSTVTVPGAFGDDASGYVWYPGGIYQQMDPFVFGRGYWIDQPNPHTWTSLLPIQKESITFEIFPGWNLLPNPHLCDYTVDGLRFLVNGVDYTFSEMLHQQLVSPAIFVYRDGEYQLSSTVYPHESFFLKYYGQPPLVTEINFVPYGDGPNVQPQTPLWYLPVSASQEGSDLDWLVIGANPISTDGYDFRLDLPQAPPKPLPGIQLYLTRSAPADSVFPEQKLHTDLVDRFNSSNQISKHWQFELDVPLAEPVMFNAVTQNVPEYYSIYLTIGNQTFNLGANPGFVYNPPNAGIHTGHIDVYNYHTSNAEFVQPQLSSLKVHPNPFNPETNISFMISREDLVGLDIYNLRGQKIKTLHYGYLTPGMHTIRWTGRDQSHRIVASGIYFARIKYANTTLVIKMMLLK
ncbi:MAG: fibronectin type III domain-containing protein [Candidatus Cloacimonetes bacterium]|nr:fibronectin type III domain-containing protein [Candidatus Cloacimonadota bacterium]